MEALPIVKNFVHYFLHFGLPLLIAFFFYRSEWKKAYLVLLLTMLVDLDHLLATPIFDPNRNSIGFHLLHSYPVIAVYAVCALFTKGYYRLFFLGLLLHMCTDFQDFYLWQ
ncbi:DUF6122 family protein [Chryseobacterium sp. A301]